MLNAYLCEVRFSKYNINESVKANLKSMNFNRPTDIQYKCIPAIMKGDDVLAIAQTGTGKTAAFAIPVIDKVLNAKEKSKTQSIRALILVPTRELSEQIKEVFQELSKGTKLKTMALYGGVEQDPQIQKLVSGVDVLVTTPGRMFDLISQGFVKLNRVDTLILDEADKMLKLGFYKDIQDVMHHLPKRKQTLFFSATIDKSIKKQAYALVRHAIRIQISPKDPVSKNVNHSVAFVEMDDKRFFLQQLVVDNPEAKILVFVRTKVRAERVLKAMNRVDIEAETLHGDKEQKERQESLKRFKTGEIKLLIATDVSARGIDIPDVDIVVNYDLPEQAENYVHRVGRTGRGRKKGDAISFCSSEEKALLEDIEKFTGNKINREYIDKSTYKDIVELADDGTDNWQALLDIDLKKRSNKRKKT
jgi:ATP-dependent RNA helicase RhlE